VKQYLLSIIQPDGDIPGGSPPPPEVLGPIMQRVRAVTAEMKAANAWVFSAGLHHPSTATMVRDGGAMVTDGPFAESKEHIGGFTIIQAADLDAALAWAKKLSAALPLPIEVRPMKDHG
jgi:hypothetical protein